MKNSLGVWSPGVPALAVYVNPDDRELDWDQYKHRLAKRLQDLAEQEQNPQAVLEQEWWDQVGNWPSLSSKGVPSLVDAPEFQELLSNRHDLHPDDFPMKVKADKNLESEGEPSSLADWVRNLR